MSCDETRDLLHGYVDGELDLVRTLQIEQHVRECPACSQAMAQQQALRTALHAGSLYHMPPEHLQGRVRAALRHASKAKARSWEWSRRWLGLVAASVVVAIILWSLVPRWSGSSAQDQLLQELVAGHVRSLMVDHLTDVASTDAHTVKPWFEGKLDFSPQVIDLRGQGFPLVGGRLDYLNNRPVAALVYQRRQHVINVYIWPSGPQTVAGTMSIARQGYQVIHWSVGGLTYWAISNLNEAELQDFARILQQSASSPPAT